MLEPARGRLGPESVWAVPPARLCGRSSAWPPDGRGHDLGLAHAGGKTWRAMSCRSLL